MVFCLITKPLDRDSNAIVDIKTVLSTGANDLFEKLKKEQTITQLQYNEMMRLCEATGTHP